MSVPALRFIHFAGIIIWFGSAAVDVLLEGVLRRTRSAEAQRTLIRFHQLVDLALEGPGALVVLGSGAALLSREGFWDAAAVWPAWLKWKVACGLVAAFCNLLSVGFVIARHRASLALPTSEAPSSSAAVRRWTIAVTLTGLAVPFALVALWLGVTRAAG
jgi:hypothetical protein